VEFRQAHFWSLAEENQENQSD